MLASGVFVRIATSLLEQARESCGEEALECLALLLTTAGARVDAARPGAMAATLFEAMNRIVAPGGDSGAGGRLGHGLGMQLTEWPSLIPADTTELRPGMVLTLEPGIELAAGRMLVHEENIVITDTGAAWLSPPADPDIMEIGT